MHDLAPLTPLGGTEPRTDAYGGVTLTEVTSTALASVAARTGKETAAAAFMKSQLGVDAPEVGRVAEKTLLAFWIGPHQWMVEAPISTHEDLAARLSSASKGEVSITEQTDGWCRFDLTGTRLEAILELLCPFDLRSATGNEAIRTTIDHLGCFVVLRGTTHLSVIGPRSSAGSLHHALLTAMRSAL